MPPKSKKSITSTENRPKSDASNESADQNGNPSEEEPSDQEKFMHLPLNVFRDLINIRELVISDFRGMKGKIPEGIEIRKEILRRHGLLVDPVKWKQLKFSRLRWLDSDAEYVLVRNVLFEFSHLIYFELIVHCHPFAARKHLFGQNQRNSEIELMLKPPIIRSNSCICL